LESLCFFDISKKVALEFDISSILRFKNLKSIYLENYIIKEIQSIPLAKLSDLYLEKLEISAKSLDLLFIHSELTSLNLSHITITGNLKFNNSFQNLIDATILGLNAIDFNRIFKAIGGSSKTLTDLNVHFPSHKEYESNVEILQRLSKLELFRCKILREVILCSN
jgi:hypothetical protein